MSPNQYHEVLIGLARALFVFEESKEDMTPEDEILRAQIANLHSQLRHAEAGHPFLFSPPVRHVADPEATVAPWSRR
jgi:hypothetical protein